MKKRTNRERLAAMSQEYERMERKAHELLANGKVKEANRAQDALWGIRHALATMGYELSVHYLTFEDFNTGNCIAIITTKT
jgi:hypothetical protein